MPKNREVVARGELVDDWPCDVDGPNESLERIYLYEGVEYSVITDRFGAVRRPNQSATVVSSEE